MDSQAPVVLRFSATVQFMEDGRSRRNESFVELPARIANEYSTASWERVEGTINGHPFRAALESSSAGPICIRLNDAMIRGACVTAGDTAELILLGPEPEPQLPADLQSAFNASVAASKVWDSLNIHNRLDWIRWIAGAAKPETRARRISRTLDQLVEGKRRACCVNVYEYMLKRIADTA